MIIVMVVDLYDQLNNGTCITAYRFAHMLRSRGHEVRVISTGGDEPDKYTVPERYWPIATPVAHMQGFVFAAADKKLFRKVFEGADVVHFLLPLHFEWVGLKIAREMGIPCSAAFHLQPENITYNINMGKSRTLSRWIYRFFLSTFYKKFDHIHCPTKFTADQLKKNGYQAKLHVISNGVDVDFVPPKERKAAADGLFRILMVGRLSPEKRQNVLIEAVRLSKYSDQIQLYLAGRGPKEKKLVRQGAQLKHPPVIGFYSKEDLIQLIWHCDLYVHASVVEIEAISCIEAFACGLVPIICNSDQSATIQFALDERSLFQPDDAAQLAEKIDYWIEHPEERVRMSAEYARQGDEYRVEKSVLRAEEMFREVIEDDRRRRGGARA